MKTKSAVVGAAGLFIAALSLSACSPAAPITSTQSPAVTPAPEVTLMASTLAEALELCRTEYKADPAEAANCELAANNTPWAP
jgi:hypothetical protein